MTSEHHPAGAPYRALAEREEDTPRDRLIASIEFALRIARTKDLSIDDAKLLEEHLLARADAYANERRHDNRPIPPPLPPRPCHAPVDEESPFPWPLLLGLMVIFSAVFGLLANWAITVRLR